jgi:hypothetical protein
MAKIFSIALFVTVLASNSVFAAEVTDTTAELKKVEVEVVEVAASGDVVSEVEVQ